SGAEAPRHATDGLLHRRRHGCAVSRGRRELVKPRRPSSSRRSLATATALAAGPAAAQTFVAHPPLVVGRGRRTHLPLDGLEQGWRVVELAPDHDALDIVRVPDVLKRIATNDTHIGASRGRR